MKVLCLDSSQESQSATLFDLSNDSVLASTCVYEADPQVQKNKRQQKSSQYLPLLVDLLSEAKLDLSDIDLIALSLGPGSFTGVRTAIMIAKTLASELKLKILALVNFDLLRFEAKLTGKDPLALRAGKTGFFVSLDDDYYNSKTNFFASNFDELDLNEAKEFQEKNLSLILAHYIAHIYKDRSEAEFDDLLVTEDTVLPYYLREPSVGVIHKAKHGN